MSVLSLPFDLINSKLFPISIQFMEHHLTSSMAYVISQKFKDAEISGSLRPWQRHRLCPQNMLQGSHKPIVFKILKLEKKNKAWECSKVLHKC